MGDTLGQIARAADQAGFDAISVMDHFFQIGMVGPPEREMLESYTALAFMAGQTSRVKLGAMVTGVVYRHPGILVKTVTSLDVLSGGRAWLGLGAAWNEQESRGLGVPFPPIAERFERLEETLQISLRMWQGDDSRFRGRHYQLDRPMNSPQPLARPHPPIMIGGMGEKKTLRLVAKYADACNFFPTPDIPHKLEVLREHCRAEGRNYDEIEKTSMYRFDVGDNGEKVQEVIGALHWLAGMGIQAVHGSVKNAHTIRPLEIMGEKLIPVVANLQPALA
jgi:F420-dependent oxidoreductase-like protein